MDLSDLALLLVLGVCAWTAFGAGVARTGGQHPATPHAATPTVHWCRRCRDHPVARRTGLCPRCAATPSNTVRYGLDVWW